MIALAIVAFIIWGFPAICLFLLPDKPWNPAATNPTTKIFDDESMRQMGRIDLNESREKQGLQPILPPKFLSPDSEDAKLLKRLDLWPKYPEGYGGVWFNDPWTRYRKLPNGKWCGKQDVVGINYVFNRFPPKTSRTR